MDIAMDSKYFTPDDDPRRNEKINEVAKKILASKHMVVFTGAGISTESGLPDYRGPEGVWTLKEQGKKPKATSRKPWSEMEPNDGHLVLKNWQDQGFLKFLISQNVDGLHLKSGIKLDLLAELHGNSTLMKCMSCDQRFTKVEIGWKKEFGKGYRTKKVHPQQPQCPSCGGRIISSVVNFGDSMPEKEMQMAEHHTFRADLFVVIGSTLAVTPAASFPMLVKKRHMPGELVIINLGETALDPIADIRLSGKASEILLAISREMEK